MVKQEIHPDINKWYSWIPTVGINFLQAPRRSPMKRSFGKTAEHIPY